MKLTQGDKNVVSNLRGKYPTELATFSDETVAKAWRNFSQSEEYPDGPFPEWAQMEHDLNGDAA